MTDISSYQNKKVDRRRSSYHLVFVTKYRNKLFKKPINAAIVKELLKAILQKYCLKIYALEVAPDHVHAFVEISPEEAILPIVRNVKALSARLIFKAIPKYRLIQRKGRLWSRYTYYESIGCVTESAIKHYIENSQDKHHT